MYMYIYIYKYIYIYIYLYITHVGEHCTRELLVSGILVRLSTETVLFA